MAQEHSMTMQCDKADVLPRHRVVQCTGCTPPTSQTFSITGMSSLPADSGPLERGAPHSWPCCAHTHKQHSSPGTGRAHQAPPVYSR